MDERDPLGGLLLQLVLLSLLAIGGINTVLPELHRVAVVAQGWLTDEEFTRLFALAQAAPGPNVIFVTLIGWEVGGLPGALLATLAICGPAVLLSYGMARAVMVWGRLPWFRLVQTGLLPLTTGLLVASAWLVTAGAVRDWRGYAVTAATVAFVLLRPRINPLWALGTAALLGIAGLV